MLRVLAIALCCAAACHGAMAQQRIDLPTRPGVVQPVVVTDARHPVAAVVLFPGGSGVVSAVRNNFLLRVAKDFVAQGITVAIADAPSDHPNGMGTGFRGSAAQATDVAAIVALLQARAHVPVWLVGTSRGSVSAANAAVRIGPPAIAGVVLTSSVWADGMADAHPSALRVPVLIVHNRADSCRVSPFSGAERAIAELPQAPAHQLLAVSGGMSRSAPCEAQSPHGYYGIEDQVVPPVIAWIKAH